MRFLLSAMLMASLLGCKQMPEPVELYQNMVVQTSRDADIPDYGFYKSFTMAADTLGLYANFTQDTFLVGPYATQVAARIKSKMQGAGYTFKTKNQSPQLGIAATVVYNYNVYQQLSYPNYYSGYYGYGFGGYYGPIVSTYEYSSAILVINLIDLQNRDAEGRLRVVWKAYIGDLEKSVDSNQKVLDAIDQAFKQSPYLKTP